MATLPRTRPALRLPDSRVTTLAGAAALVLFLLAASLWLRTRALGGGYWMDEGLSVGIASHDFFDIPGLLKQDGSPPLYYLLLHLWMNAVGDSEQQTHALSLLFALASIPTALWAGWSLWGLRAGLIAAALAAVSPFLTAYGQETRMYSLVGLLSIVAAASFVHAFLHRRRRYVPVFAVALTAMLYTHNWALFFAVGAALAVVPCVYRRDDSRSVLRDAALAFGGAALLFLPWLPTLLYQAAHTGAPWTQSPRFGVVVQVSRGLFGGSGAFVALVIGGALGFRGVVRNVRSTEMRTIVALLTMALATLALAWLLSQLSPAWNVRYFGAVLGPLLLAAAYGTSRAGVLGVVAVIAACLLAFRPQAYNYNNKSNMRDVAAYVRDQLRPGDAVLSMQPEQLPAVYYYLPGPFRYATTLGPSDDPQVMDWVDGLDRLKAARPARELRPLLDRQPVGSRVVVIRPVTWGTRSWQADWTRLVRRRSAQWTAVIAADPRFELTDTAPVYYKHASIVGVSALVYTKARGR